MSQLINLSTHEKLTSFGKGQTLFDFLALGDSPHRTQTCQGREQIFSGSAPFGPEVARRLVGGGIIVGKVRYRKWLWPDPGFPSRLAWAVRLALIHSRMRPARIVPPSRGRASTIARLKSWW